jgi:hypothetical protein
MKDCGIVKDLLPLVAEQLASEESTAFVKEHLKTCADCKAAFDAMQAPVEAEPAAPLKTVRKAVKRRGLLIAGLIACLVAALIFGVFARLMKPIPIRSVDEVFDTVTVSVPKTGAEYEADQWELFLSDNTATSSLSVTPEVMKLEVESDGMVYRDGACNNTDLFWLLDRRQTSLSDEEALAYEAVQEIARQQGWILFDTTPHPKTGRRYPDLIIPDRVSVEMWTEPGIYLQIMYGGTTFSNRPSKVDDLLSGNTADRSLRKDPSNKTMSIAAYTTYMERIKAKLGLQAGISRSDGFVMDLDELDEISFEPYNNTDREVLYVRDGYTPEAGFALPRLVLNYYFLIATIGTAILAIVWLVLRLCKKEKAARVLGVLLILAGSFVLAFLAAGFPATTIAPGRELAFVLVIALLLIGAGLCGRKLLRKE